MDPLTIAFSLIEAVFYFVERSGKTREEKDEMNMAIRAKFEQLANPSTLKDTVEE